MSKNRISNHSYLLNKWITYNRRGYTWKEMTILIGLAKQIDAAKLQYFRLRRVRNNMRKITQHNYPRKMASMTNYFIDLEFLFSSFHKIFDLISLLSKESNKILSVHLTKYSKVFNNWEDARNWVEHPEKKINQKGQKAPSDYGNMVGDYYSIAGIKYDVLLDSQLEVCYKPCL